MTAEENWFERYIDERIREHEERVRLRELKRAAREADIVARPPNGCAKARSAPGFAR